MASLDDFKAIKRQFKNNLKDVSDGLDEFDETEDLGIFYLFH
jgi:hypothetical protein